MADGPRIGEMIQQHPQVILGGAVVIGILFFASSSKPKAQPDTSLVDVTPKDPPEQAITADQLQQIMADYDTNIRDYINQQIAMGQMPNPNPEPLPYPVPYPVPGPQPQPLPEVEPAYHPGILPIVHYCPPGYTWSLEQGRCTHGQ